MAMQLDIKDLCKNYGKHGALVNVSFHLPKGKILALLGPSGGGKSTLLRILAGLEYPEKGVILMDEKPLIFNESSLLLHRRSIGTVFQSFNLFPHLTALENISLPLHVVHGHSLDEANALSFELLKRFRLEPQAHKKPEQLSGGQCQRIAIVRAVAIKPKMLFFDEPTSALDPVMTAEVLDLIVELKQEGRNFLLVSHHMGFVKKIADWIAFLSEGKVVESASADEFFANPKSPQVQEFLDKVLKY